MIFCPHFLSTFIFDLPPIFLFETKALWCSKITFTLREDFYFQNIFHSVQKTKVGASWWCRDNFTDNFFFFQGDSISQWWQWQPPKGSSNHGSTTTLKANVIRTNSLKEKGHSFQDDDDDDDDEVFVTADPVRGQHVTVKSAIISTTNPYCTSSRVPKKRISARAVEASAPSPSSESSESSLVLSSASSTSSHSAHANPGSIVSHDQVCIKSSFANYLPLQIKSVKYWWSSRNDQPNQSTNVDLFWKKCCFVFKIQWKMSI